MKLTILGTGTCCNQNRGAAANYLEIGNKKVVVEFGPGGLRQLARSGHDYREIDMAFFSHIHTDHILDLAALLQALYWSPDDQRTKPLVLVGPVGFKQYVTAYILPIAQLPHPEKITFSVEIIELEKQRVWDDFAVDCIRTIHDTENASIAYRFTEGDHSLVVSGDCAYDEKLVSFCQDADLLLLECSYADGILCARHLHSSECGEIARQAKAKRLILTHLHPTSSEELRLKETQALFAHTSLAEELMEIEL